MKETAATPHAIGLLLAGAMCLLPFLIPYHQLPLLSFYPEWLAAVLGICAALLVLAWRGVALVSVPAPAVWLIAFAVYLLARMADHGQAYPQVSLLAAFYVLFAALMMWLGAQLAWALGAERVALVLAGFLLAGAFANALAGAIQFYGRPVLLEDVVARLNGNRAYGNIAQSNLYANYLTLGQTAILFLWLRMRVRTAYALPALVFLAACTSLSGSRGALAYAIWIGLLGYATEWLRPGWESRRLKVAAYGVAGIVLAAHFAVPWLNYALQLGPASEGALNRLEVFAGQGTELRWKIYSLGLRVFGTAPIVGVGMGGFPGAAFESGLDPTITQSGEVLTSPHSLPLHLLAETGAIGAALVLGGLCVWCWQIARRYGSSPRPETWWIVAATGVGLLHSLFEFPMWSAHFLGLTALLMGVGAFPGASSRPMPGPGRIAASGSCLVLLVALAMLLRDYVRLDTTRVTGSAVTLASPADAQRDAEILRRLGHGLMAPVAELWILTGAPLDRSDLADKLARSGRVASFWPSNDVAVRRAAFLALHGDAEDARSLLERVLRAFPQRREATMAILENASTADTEALLSLIVIAREAKHAPSPLAP